MSEAKARYSKSRKRVYLPKTITLPAGLTLDAAPSVVKLSGDWYQCIIPIGNDNVAYLILDDEAVRALNLMNPESSIS